MRNINFRSRNFLIGALVVLILIAGFSYWFYSESSKLYVGEKTQDDGRQHVSIGTNISYRTNPPTSGSHYEDWKRAGIYDTPPDDRNLVHSLEHGYVIMSYNCDYGINSPKEASSSAQTASSSALSATFQSANCKKLIQQLTDIYNGKGKKKLIVTPRPNLDARIALTAWTRLDKFNTLDKSRIEKFIDARRNMGPEKTME